MLRGAYVLIRYINRFYCFIPGIIVAHYLQSVTPALVLGGELVYHKRPGEEGTVTSLLGRYTGKIRYVFVLVNLICSFKSKYLICRKLTYLFLTFQVTTLLQL